MYNRYIPQPDGSYRRNPTQEQRPGQHRPASPNQKPPARAQNPPQDAPVFPTQQRKQPPPSEPITGFLRQLIPSGFDTGDLIVVLLLLLIAGDSQENRNHALLTLALYFIL